MIHAAAAARDEGLLKSGRVGIVLVPDEETAGFYLTGHTGRVDAVRDPEEHEKELEFPEPLDPAQVSDAKLAQQYGEVTGAMTIQYRGEEVEYGPVLEIFSMPKHSVWRSFVISHLIHHRAQLGVYLRLLDVPVPSTYGPSADEGSL